MKQHLKPKTLIILDVILIIILLGILYYSYSEIENIKLLNGNVCRLCEEKTGGVCVKNAMTTPKESSKIYINKTKLLGFLSMDENYTD